MTTDMNAQRVSDDEIVERALSLPDLDGYPGVDELLSRLEELRLAFPGLLTVRRVGTSRLGEPISLYTLALGDQGDPGDEVDAPRHALLVGGVHPNEPIGSHTILRLLSDLLRDDDLRRRLGVVWHVIPCIDPDGMRLNEGWFDNPFDDETYFRHFYRPAGAEQVEWTFPISYKSKYFDAMLPETQALQRVLDEVRPDYYVPLHNSETGGAYFYVSEPLRELVPLLHRLPTDIGIPLHLGEPEAAHFTELAPAIFVSGTPEDVYDWREANGLDPAPPGGAGQSSGSYARRHGTVSLIAELPVWRTFGADDISPSDANYADLLREAGDALSETGAHLERLLAELEPHLALDTPFLRSARVFVPGMSHTGRAMRQRAAAPENDRVATVAERPMSVVWMYRLRFGGALLRALKAEVAAGTARVSVRRAARELEELWSGWLVRRQQDEQTDGIPVTDVVGVQYGAVLGFVAHGPYAYGTAAVPASPPAALQAAASSTGEL
ncbi:M14 family zinc carboxypeptidase [Microbacterium marinilacus]|uniref:M14 family zinc carboxypeptidase n=1 Tax=Microbacterium marinilacus TaxID=415209 RepID=A0ABP7BST5_9MICO|nr:M14 family zinc carboxypeptidase [Microbacterium marinilacus]MBY0690414.1 peptidase M14 [Microbacterium marinilacus]